MDEGSILNGQLYSFIRRHPCAGKSGAVRAGRNRQKHLCGKIPVPVFIDTEGGTKKLNVNRLPQPTSWAMLMDEANEVRLGHIPCGTLVIDTADWPSVYASGPYATVPT